MTKKLDLNRTVFELTEQYPEVIGIMKELGFSEITNEEMRTSVGKVMTIPKGARVKQIPIEKIVRTFAENGFEVVGVEIPEQVTDKVDTGAVKAGVKKKIDLNRTVFELTEEYPEVIDIMVKLGFSEITNKMLRHSVGKVMTIPKGAKVKQIPIETIVRTFAENGFEVDGFEVPAQTSGKTKKLDLSRTVFELTEQYPEVIGIMAKLGFSEITNEEMRQSAGKVMTIPKGAKVKQIPMENIIRAFTESGFEVEGLEISEQTAMTAGGIKTAAIISSDNSSSRTEQLKAYLRRLNEGEDLESVRADFVRDFGEVEASEIMKAEQEMLKSGTPLTEVQKLCDVHSALFHGATREERIANAEKAVAESLKRQASVNADYNDRIERAAALEAVKGHPLQTFTRENDELAKLIEETKTTLSQKGDLSKLLPKIRELSTHYAKKGDLLYPHLKLKYGIFGPSEVMWTVDDEIRDELAALSKETERGEEWLATFSGVLKRAEEMIYKEQNILFPICAVNFTEDEWKNIYRDSKDYDACFGVKSEVWEEAEKNQNSMPSANENEIVMPGGRLTLSQLTALLNTIPMEITFVDDKDINRYFNEGPKVFKRPSMAIDRDVFSCHPPKIEPMVRSIIDGFRSGKNDSVPVWMEKGGRTMLVKYMAVRDNNGNYMGTVELVQDMEFAKEYFKREQIKAN